MVTLRPGVGYKAQVNVTNQSTRGGVPVAATLTLSWQVLVEIYPEDSTGGLTVLTGGQETLSLKPGQSVDSLFPFSVPDWTAGMPGIIKAWATSPTGVMVASGSAAFQVEPVAPVALSPSVAEVRAAPDLATLESYRITFEGWRVAKVIDYATYLIYYDAYKEAYYRLVATVPTPTSEPTPTPTNQQQCLLDADAFYNSISEQLSLGLIDYATYTALYEQYVGMFYACYA